MLPASHPPRHLPRRKNKVLPMQTADRVRQVLQKVMVIDGARLTDEARLVEDLEATSLDRIEAIMALEEEFGIEIPQDAAESIRTVGDLVRFVEARTG
jgi:acyl carrier protein